MHYIYIKVIFNGTQFVPKKKGKTIRLPSFFFTDEISFTSIVVIMTLYFSRILHVFAKESYVQTLCPDWRHLKVCCNTTIYSHAIIFRG